MEEAFLILAGFALFVFIALVVGLYSVGYLLYKLYNK